MLLSARKMAALQKDRELILLGIEDVTPRLTMEEELRQERRKAEAASRAKSEFLATLSHEIRTPMTVVLGAVEMLQGTELAPEQQRYLTMVENSARALTELLGDILDFSMIEANKITLEHRPFRLRGWAENCIGVLQTEAGRRGLALSLEVATEVPGVIVGDSHRLRQILVNLVGNALKFTEQGEVKVRIELIADDLNRRMVRVVVSDTGIGIPEDKIDLIFSSFSQADASMTRKYGGTGLGLAICKQLVERMGGKIGVSSEPGKGSTFFFTVPLVEADGQPEEEIAEETGPPEPPARTAPDRTSRVLIVEDDKDIRNMMELLLGSRGWQTASAAGGEEALRRLESETFDLVLMDWQMPNMDGREVTLAIRAREKGTDKHLPIIGITGHARKDDRQRCLEAGMDDYLTKPFTTDQLFAAMERLLAAHS
jgi:signal transduction histidine kinase/ActR/RegA family two-component response regulator